MKLSNQKMDECYTALNNVSEKTNGKLGYAIARNLRKLSEELVEYHSLKDKAICKYGEEDSEGRITIHLGSEAFDKFKDEMKEYMSIEHDVQIFTVTEDEVLNSDLNAKEMLAIDFMIQD